MKNNVIFGMGIFHTANGLKVLRQAKINVRQMSRGDSFGCVIFKILWDNGAKTQPRQNTEGVLTVADLLQFWGWAGGAKVLGKLPVRGRPSNLDYSEARAYCACRRCGWGLFGHFSFIYHFSLLSPSLWEMARYRLKYCLKGLLSPKQPTNQLHFVLLTMSPVLRCNAFWCLTGLIPYMIKIGNNQEVS